MEYGRRKSVQVRTKERKFTPLLFFFLEFKPTGNFNPLTIDPVCVAGKQFGHHITNVIRKSRWF